LVHIGPTVPPPGPESLNSSLRRNIEALRRRREQEDASASLEERVAAAITRFTGSMRFVYVHAALYGSWILLNSGLVGDGWAWDPSFVMLAMVASVEAIFLSTFILISQNRMAAAAERRAELDLQVSLLAEHEITRLVQLVSNIADRLEVTQEGREELEELKRTVAPEAVLDAIEESARGSEAD
jgi:uncharacterized membrane protein